jgi:hypothetical protein
MASSAIAQTSDLKEVIMKTNTYTAQASNMLKNATCQLHLLVQGISRSSTRVTRAKVGTMPWQIIPAILLAFFASPMAFACFNWGTLPIQAPEGQFTAINLSGSLTGVAAGYYIMATSQSGTFTLPNPQFFYNNYKVNDGTNYLPTGPIKMLYTDYVPSGVTAGQTATLTYTLTSKVTNALVCKTTITVNVVKAPTVVGAPGWNAQGAGIAIGDINGRGTKDMVLMTVDDPGGQNYFRYEIGWDLDATGKAASWSQFPQVGGATWESQGGGVAITNLNYNPKPDLVFMTIDHPGNGPNSFHYTICWDVDTNGNPVWCQIEPVVGGLGWSNQGGGIGYAQIDNDSLGQQDMVLMGIDHPGGQNNSFWYSIGWNVDPYTGAPATWSPVIRIDGVGWEAAGGALALVNLDTDSRPELVLMAVDNPLNGTRTYRYKIGWNLDTTGHAQWWSSGTQAIDYGQLLSTQGAGVAFADLDKDVSNQLDMVLMSLEHSGNSNNEFHYRVRFNVDSSSVMNNWD